MVNAVVLVALITYFPNFKFAFEAVNTATEAKPVAATIEEPYLLVIVETVPAVSAPASVTVAPRKRLNKKPGYAFTFAVNSVETVLFSAAHANLLGPA